MKNNRRKKVIYKGLEDDEEEIQLEIEKRIFKPI